MKRRSLLVGLPMTALALAGCASTAPLAHKRPYKEIEEAKSADKSAATVLVFMPNTVQAQEVWRGLRDEVSGEFNLIAVEAEGECRSVLERGLAQHHPSAIVIMNNPTLSSYREYQLLNRGVDFPPAFVVMTSFLGQQRSLISTTGISYEVPLITVVTNLRKLVSSPISRVGIIARPGLMGFIREQERLAEKESVVAVVEEVSAKPNVAEVRRALRIIKSTSDAVWVLNDNQLLTPKLISEGWVPGMNEHPWVPVIVGAAPLVAPGANFGTFALVPDHPGLGAQLANMIFNLSDDDWVLREQVQVEVPVSTVSTMDFGQANERLALRADAVQKIDRVLR